MTYTEDSLKVSENEDGTFAIEWDANDPRYALFNTMTEEDMQEFMNKAIEQFILDNEDGTPN